MYTYEGVIITPIIMYSQYILIKTEILVSKTISMNPTKWTEWALHPITEEWGSNTVLAYGGVFWFWFLFVCLFTVWGVWVCGGCGGLLISLFFQVAGGKQTRLECQTLEWAAKAPAWNTISHEKSEWLFNR